MARRAGYEVLDVDSFIDQAQAALSGSRREQADFRSTVAGTRFRMARRSGYEVEAVDAFLDRLAASLPDESAAAAPSGASADASSEDSWVGEARWLAKVASFAFTAKDGYDALSVDTFVDQVEAYLRDADANHDQLQAYLLDPPLKHGASPGYAPTGVEDLLQRLRALAGVTGGSRSPRG